MLKVYYFTDAQLPLVVEICSELFKDKSLAHEDRDFFEMVHIRLATGETKSYMFNDNEADMMLKKITQMPTHNVLMSLAQYIEMRRQETTFE